MRIKRRDPERLVITHFPVFAALFGALPAVILLSRFATGDYRSNDPSLPFAVCFALAWTGFFAWFARGFVFDFDLVRREFHWTNWGLFGTKSGVLPFSEIKFASDQTSQFPDGDVGHRPVLLTRGGTLPLLNYSTVGFLAGWKFRRLAGTINAALGLQENFAAHDAAIAKQSRQGVGGVRMSRNNWVFGIWALVNIVAAAALEGWELKHGQWPEFLATFPAALPVVAVLLWPPFIQSIFVAGKLDLNSGRFDSSDHRREVWLRWKRLFFELPLASAFLVVCFIHAAVMMVANGSWPSAQLTGKTHVNRLLISAGAICFSAVSAYVNLAVVRKYGQIFDVPKTRHS